RKLRRRRLGQDERVAPGEEPAVALAEPDPVDRLPPQIRLRNHIQLVGRRFLRLRRPVVFSDLAAHARARRAPSSLVDWSPFRGAARGAPVPRARGLNGPDGLGDRLRTAAFAELQAAAAFRWAVEHVEDADAELRAAWTRFAEEESKHYGWILQRMMAL